MIGTSIYVLKTTLEFINLFTLLNIKTSLNTVFNITIRYVFSFICIRFCKISVTRFHKILGMFLSTPNQFRLSLFALLRINTSLTLCAVFNITIRYVFSFTFHVSRFHVSRFYKIFFYSFYRNSGNVLEYAQSISAALKL